MTLTPASPASRRGTERWIPLLLVLVTLVAMGRLCAAEFIHWDDQETLFKNPRMSHPSVENVLYYWTHPHMGLYIPVTYTVWGTLATIAQVEPGNEGITLNPWVFHTANVLVHVANVLLVYRVLRLILPGRAWPAAIGAMIFAVHPVQVESVGWTSGLKDLLCGTFVLLAVWQYLLAIRNPQSAIRNGHYWLGIAFMILGMLSKPTTVVTPVIIAVLDRWVVGRSWRDMVKSAWPWALVAVPCLIWAKAVQSVPPFAPLWARPLIAGDAVAFYLWKLVWPFGLTMDYEHNPRLVMQGSAWLLTWIIPVTMAVILWIGRNRRPFLLAAGLVFVAGMLPVLGFSPFMFQGFSTTADHYLYLPMVGVAMGAAWAVGRWSGRGTAIAAVIVVVALAARSVDQAGYWLDERRLYWHALAVSPESFEARIHVASDLEEEAKSDPARADELLAGAEHHLREAVRIQPDIFLPRFNLALILIKRGKPVEAVGPLQEAIARYRPAADRELIGRAHHLLGAGLWRQGKREAGLAHFRKAVEYRPADKEFVSTLRAAERSMQPATTRAAGGSQ